MDNNIFVDYDLLRDQKKLIAEEEKKARILCDLLLCVKQNEFDGDLSKISGLYSQAEKLSAYFNRMTEGVEEISLMFQNATRTNTEILRDAEEQITNLCIK